MSESEIRHELSLLREEMSSRFSELTDLLERRNQLCLEHSKILAKHEALLGNGNTLGKALMKLIAIIGTIVSILAAGFIGMKITEAGHAKTSEGRVGGSSLSRS